MCTRGHANSIQVAEAGDFEAEFKTSLWCVVRSCLRKKRREISKRKKEKEERRKKEEIINWRGKPFVIIFKITSYSLKI